MVSTRHHPRPFPEPASPTSRSTATATTTPSKPSSTSRARLPSPTAAVEPASEAISNAVSKLNETRTPARKRKSTVKTAALASYTHRIDPVIVLWLLVSLPLVFWDTGYVFCRPLSMPGGSLHAPIWSLYGLYGTVDHIYGLPAWAEGNGFTAAQASLNAVESAMYIYYLVILLRRSKGEGVFRVWREEFWTEKKLVGGQGMAAAVLLCLCAAVMTLSKTILYWANESFSGFKHIGHNAWVSLFWLWILPNGLWLVFPTYMIYSFSKEIIGAMHLAGSGGLDKVD